MTTRMTEIFGSWIVVAVLAAGVAAILPALDRSTPVVAATSLTAVDVPRSRAWQPSIDLTGLESGVRYGSRRYAHEDMPVWARGHMPTPTRVTRAGDRCQPIDACAIDAAAATTGLSKTSPC